MLFAELSSAALRNNRNEMAHIPPPQKLPLAGLTQVRPKTSFNGQGRLRKRWVDGSGNIYEWDYQHGRLEMYDSKGKHVGEIAVSGTQTKKADPARKVKP